MTREQQIHNATMEILQEVGVKFYNPQAQAILQENGIRVENDTAFFTEEQVMHWVHQAPDQFTLYGRNERYRVNLGDGSTNPSPAYGCAFIAERDGTRRDGMMADYLKAVKLVHTADVYNVNGGILVQPNDIDDKLAPLAMFYATLTHSDKAMMISTADKDVLETMLKAAATVFGGEEAMAQKPRMMALINTNSPLSIDGKMLDNLMTMARYGQPVIVCPAAMLGTTGPLFMASTLAMGAAESLAGIALAQMVRPGTPCVFGVQSTAADMQGLSFACSAPESTLLQGFAANLGRFYGLPSRGGGCQCDAPWVNVQAGYESMLTFSSAYRHGINFVMEAGGIVASVNATSFDKMLVDFEIIRQVKFAFTPFEVNEETLSVEEVKEGAQGGSYLETDTTLDNFTELYRPTVGGREATSPTYFEDSLDKQMATMLAQYDRQRPTLDQETLAAVTALFVEAGLSQDQLNTIATA